MKVRKLPDLQRIIQCIQQKKVSFNPNQSNLINHVAPRERSICQKFKRFLFREEKRVYNGLECIEFTLSPQRDIFKLSEIMKFYYRRL